MPTSQLAIIITGLPLAGKTTLRRELCSIDPVRIVGCSCSDILVRSYAEKIGSTVEAVLADKESHRRDLMDMGDCICSVAPEALAIAAWREFCSTAPVGIIDGVRRAPELAALVRALRRGGADTLVIWKDRIDRPDVKDNTTVSALSADFICERQIPADLPGYDEAVALLRSRSRSFTIGGYFFARTN